MKASVLKRTVSLLCTAALLLQFSATAGFAAEESDKNGDSYTRELEIRTDMVHDNPGGNPYVTQYDDVEYLADIGLTGKVFFLSESAHLAIDWQDYDKNVFPEGSDGYKWVQQKKAEYRAKYKEAKDAGLKVYFMMDFISLPNSMKTLYGDQILTGGKIDINKPKTKEIMAEMMREVFEEFPEIDGIYPRYGESYVGFYSGHHFGNNPIGVSGTKANDHATLLKFFRDEVCEKLDKEIVYRTWSTEVGNDSFTTSKNLYLQITNQVEPHENLYIAIKHTAGDFWRNYTFNETIGIGKHKQIIEVQCAREYEGKGTYPNYVAGSVINGFKEYEWQMDENANKSLRDVVNCENSLIAGIWTWSRGGGWGGPYPNGQENPEGDELWCDLNAYVLHKWAQDTSRTDKSIVIEYAKEKLGMGNTDAENFYKLAALSSDAVLYGIGTDTSPTWDTLWTRDASVDKTRFNSNLSVMYANKTDGKYVKLEERRRAVELWAEMVEIANGFSDSVEMKEYIKITATYGHYLFSIWERMWTAGILYTERNVNGKKNAGQIMKVINEYRTLWSEWEAFKEENPSCPTLYDKSYFDTIINGFVCSDEVFADNRTIGPNTNMALLMPSSAKFVSASAPSSFAFDGDMSTRWDTPTTSDDWATQWLQVDLGTEQTVNEVIIYWESAYAKAYKLQYSNDGVTFTDIKNVTNGDGGTDTLSFDELAARYIRLQCSARGNDKGSYSIYELEVYNRNAEGARLEISDNLALNSKAEASYTHNSFNASNVTNGQNSLVSGNNAPERWNGGNIDEECWIKVDMGEEKTFNRVTLYWNYNNCPKAYEIQVSSDGESWTTAQTVNCGAISSASTTDYILAHDMDMQTARYVRVFVSKENRESGGGKWVSLVELEVYTVGGSNASEQRMFLDGTDTEGVYDMYVLTNITKADTENNDRVSLIGRVTNTSNGKTADITLDIHDAFKYIDVVGVAYSAGDFDAGTDNDYLIGYTLKNVKVGYKIEYRICGFDKENKEVWTTENIIYTVK